MTAMLDRDSLPTSSACPTPYTTRTWVWRKTCDGYSNDGVHAIRTCPNRDIPQRLSGSSIDGREIVPQSTTHPGSGLSRNGFHAGR